MKRTTATSVVIWLVPFLFLDSVNAQRFGRSRIFQRRPARQYDRQTHPRTTRSPQHVIRQQQPTDPTASADLDQDPKTGTRYALIIATREYPRAKQLKRLAGTNRDADRTRTMLVRGGFKKENIVVVYDDAIDRSLRPSKRNIDQQMNRIVKKARKDDIVLVMATGHGVSIDDTSYYCPFDATDESLTDLEAANRQLISVAKITRQLSLDCEALNKLVVVDACRNEENRTSKFVSGLSNPEDGVWLINSCSENQLSWMSDSIKKGERHAIFSYYFAEGVAGAADLIGDNDGEVWLAELYSFAYQKTTKAASQKGKTQEPEMFGLGPNFAVSTYSTFVPSRKLTTSNAELERRRTATLIAEKGLKNIRVSERRFGIRFVNLASKNDSQALDNAYREHYNEISYALGAYSVSALQLDADCRLAILTQGLGFRACGLYEEALTKFQKADEHFELFVKGDSRSIQNYLAFEDDHFVRESNGGHVLKANSKEKKIPLGMVDLHVNPDPNSPTLKQQIEKHSKIRIAKVSDEWLLVSAVNDRDLETHGWIPRKSVHWFAEAADLYTPDSPLTRHGSTLGRLDHTVSHMERVASRFDLATARINQLAIPFYQTGARIRNAGRNAGQPIREINRVLGFVGRFAPVPSIPNYPEQYANLVANYTELPGNYIHQVGGYIQIPANYMRVAQGYVNLPSSYAGISRNWARSTRNYYRAVERSNRMNERRNKLIKAKHLPRVTPKDVPVTTITI